MTALLTAARAFSTSGSLAGGLCRTLTPLLLAALLAAPGWGIETVIEGRVRSEDGEPVVDAVVEAADQETSTRSGPQGHFLLESVALPVVLEVSHPAFAAASVELDLDTAQPVDVRLVRLVIYEEELVVGSQRLGERFSPQSIAVAGVDPREPTVAPDAVSAAVTRVAGVAENGQGGLFQVVSIRGVSRQRVLSLISGARITSERRAGGSTSFLDPLLVGEVEVLRGPASTYYGSGALGGALYVEPRTFRHLGLEVGFESQGDGAYQSLGWGAAGWSLGLVHRESGPGEAATGELLNDGFEQLSGVLKWRFGDGERSSELLVVGAYGDDIGKSNVGFPMRTTTYPRERHLLLRFGTGGGHRWRANAFVHPQDLETRVLETGRSESLVHNESLDFGGLFERILPLGGQLDGRAGVDYFARRGVEIRERATDLDGGTREEISTLEAGEEDEVAAFAVVNWQWGRLRGEVGARAVWVRQSNRDRSSRERSHLTGFLGAATALVSRLELVGNVGRGVRVPSLSEQFFTGTTGRGRVVGNPELISESALNADLGLRWLGDRLLLRATVYRNEIDDYIERIELTPELLTFQNLATGQIEGWELDGLLAVRRQLRLGFGLHRLEGEDRDRRALADIPPRRARLEVRFTPPGWRTGVEISWRSDKTDPGSGEKPISEALLLGAMVGRELTGGLELTLRGSNLLDELYYPAADREATYGRGRSLAVVVGWRGR